MFRFRLLEKFANLGRAGSQFEQFSPLVYLGRELGNHRKFELKRQKILERTSFLIFVYLYFPDIINSIRKAHTDIPEPNFDDYRKKSNRDPSVPANRSADERKAFMYATSFGEFVDGIFNIFFYENKLLNVVSHCYFLSEK